MEISGLLVKMTSTALETVMKHTKASIRSRGEENIPDLPTVFVANHFTRIETFFLPYIISRFTKKGILTLATGELFGGNFGRFLRKLGAVPSDNSDRDKILITSLLKGERHCLIFPEGQMIKDKKIIERGKHLIYNSGIRRPPHTGAAVVAILSEFYRHKLRYFTETGNDSSLEQYKSYFDIKSTEEIDKIIMKATNIVPLNITYFPIRARRNIINFIAEKLIRDLPERLSEELEVEISMMIDGVDIDINFGSPIPVYTYLKGRKFLKKIRAGDLLLDKTHFKEDSHLRRYAVALTHRYMKSIYEMTTINHDHILGYLVARSKRKGINEDHLKNKAFLIFEEIWRNARYFHSSLKKDQDDFLLDASNKKYSNFIKCMEKESLISVTHGMIIKNMEKFSKPYPFHSIRKDNLIEVLKNEIEPLRDIRRSFERLNRTPMFFVRRRILKKFLRKENDSFKDDYNKYFIEGETKPEIIGAPFFMKRYFRRKGVLLIHGYMSAPEEMRDLGRHLYKSGYTVYGVRLSGHGTSPEDLAARTWRDWLVSVRRGSQVLSNSVKKCAIVGFSTGACLGLLETAGKRDSFACMVSINAPLRLANIASSFAPGIVYWNQALEKFRIPFARMEYLKNKPENPHINYHRNPISGIAQLEELMRRVRQSLEYIKIPTLVVQGDCDPVVNPKSGEEIFEDLGSPIKEFSMIESNHHVIVKGKTAEEVFRQVDRFLSRHL